MDSSALNKLLGELGVKADAEVHFEGDDPVVVSPHRVGAATATALAAQGVAASALWRMRGGQPQTIRIKLSDAVDALDTGHFLLQNGHKPNTGLTSGPSTGMYKTADGRWVLPVAPRAKLRDGLIDFFACGHNAPAISAVIAKWNAQDLEDALAEKGLVCCIVRSPEEWRAHPHGQWLAAKPVVQITRIGDSAPEPLSPSPTPLGGIHVLEAAHIIAGPTSGRSMAEHGAEVLRISSINQPDDVAMIMDTGFGVRNAYLDLTAEADQRRMEELVREADVFVQSYRPGSMAKRGLDPARLAQIRPGIIYVSVSCYGDDGPWAGRPGFDNNGQAVAGISATEGSLEQPVRIPTGLLADCLTGYLAATGAMAALARRAREGGSYHVRLSLTRSCMWVQEFGLMSPDVFKNAPPRPAPNLARVDSVFGELEHLRPPLRMSLTPPQWRFPPTPQGSSKPAWQPRSG
jgi:crotonobetainyl-CoA:carnitine CoA-transferase CaiB-like acyl-CoA transferase